MQQNWAGFTTGSMKNVETVNLNNTAGTALTYAAIGTTGVNKYVVDATKGAISLSDLTELAAVEVAGPANTNAITVTYGAATTVATGTQTDTQSLKVTNVGTANTKTDGTNDAKVGTVTIAKVEALALETAGDANTLNLQAVSDAKSITVKGAGTTEIQAVGTATTGFDASAATGKVIVNLSNAASNALATAKTGAGDDTITVVADDLTSSAVIGGGAGADKLVIAAGAGKVLQATMTGIETMDIGNVSSTLTFSGTNVSDLATVNVENLTAAGASLVNMKAAALTVNSVGANTQTFSADNAAAVTYNLNASKAVKTAGTASSTNASDATFGGATTLTVNVGEQVITTGGDIAAAAAKDVVLNVAGKVSAAGAELSQFDSVLTTAEATSVKINSTGQLGGSAAVTAAKATTGTIVAGSAANVDDTLALTAAKMATLDVTAKQNITFAGSTLTGLQTLTVDTTKAYTQGVALDDANSVTVKGSAGTSAATFGTLGAGTLTHAVNLTATGLKAGLTTGNINAGTSTSTIDIAGVTGNVQLGDISANTGITLKASTLGGTLNATAKNLATTTGNISVDLSSAQGQAKFGTINAGTGDVTLLATSSVGGLLTGKITGNNVTINAGQALGTVTINDSAGTNADDITAKTSVTYTGANIADNGVDITTATTSTAFTATLNGGAANETITIAAGGTAQSGITVTGNLGGGTNLVTTTVKSDSTANQTVSLAGLTSSATAGDATFETETTLTTTANKNVTFTGSVKDDEITLASGNTGVVSISDSTTTDKDMLVIGGTYTQLSLSGIEGITTSADATVNFSAVSGKTIALTNSTSKNLTLSGTAAADVIDAGNISGAVTAAADEFIVLADAGNDTIVGLKAGAGTYDGGAGNDIITGGAGADVIIGGNGNDVLTGGAGIDAFVLTGTSAMASNLNNGGFDTITDFRASGMGSDIVAFGSTWLGGTAFGSGSFVSVSNNVSNGLSAHSDKIIAVAGSLAGADASGAIATLVGGNSGLSAAGSQDVVIVANNGSDTYIWYVNDSLDGTETNVTATDIVLIGKLTGFTTTMEAGMFGVAV